MSGTEKKRAGLSRRDFVKSAGVVGVGGLAAAALAGCASEGGSSSGGSSSAQNNDWLPEAWEAEADIIVVGYGGAGAAAAICSAQEDLGEVLVLEVAPEGEEGGNSGVCGQIVLCPPDKDELIAYQKTLNGPYVIEEELLEAWASEMVKNVEWLEGLDLDMQSSIYVAPEFPEYAEDFDIQTFVVGEVFGDRKIWYGLKEAVDGYGLKVLYDTRVQRLIQNPNTKEVVGVIAMDDDGNSPRYFKARKGVVLACGGFENNPDMLRQYYMVGMPNIDFRGTPWNRGDGITMSQQVGAKLWHMNATACQTYATRNNPDQPNSVAATFTAGKDWIYVGPDAKRIRYEETFPLQRHGKQMNNTIYHEVFLPDPCYAIFTDKSFDGAPIMEHNGTTGWVCCMDMERPTTNAEALEMGCMFKADNIEDLAAQIGLNPASLAETINTYNGYCAEGNDLDFRRGTDVYDTSAGSVIVNDEDGNASVVGAAEGETGEMKVVVQAFPLEPIEGSSYYALRMYPSMLNTQGGPKRGTGGEVLDVDENPIPRLYAAGELGTIFAYLYNGGGNLAEALSSGRIAARSIGALTSWEA